MSTKVYTAYKLKDHRQLWDVVKDIKAKGLKNVREVLKTQYHVFASTADVTSEEYKSLTSHGGSDWYARHRIAERILREGYLNQLGSYERNEFNFDVNVGIWKHKRYYYLIPFCDLLMRDVLKFLGKDERLQNFQYWNNTDKLKEVPYREWQARGKVWDAIHAEGWQNHLVLDICSWTSWNDANPYMELAEKRSRLLKKKVR